VPCLFTLTLEIKMGMFGLGRRLLSARRGEAPQAPPRREPLPEHAAAASEANGSPATEHEHAAP